MPGAVFIGLEFVVEPIAGSENKSAEVKKKIIDNEGVLSRIVTEETSFVVICDVINVDHASPRLAKAQQYNVPIVSAEYIEGCVRLGHKLPYNDFTVIIKTVRIEEHAEISPSTLNKSDKPLESAFTHPSKVPVWNWSDPNSPTFPSGEEPDASNSYELVKSVLLQKTNSKKEVSEYGVLEVHTWPRCKGQQENQDNKDIQRYSYRVFTHYGNLQDVQDINSGKKECRYAETGREAEQVYSYLFDDFTSQGFHKTTTLLSRWIGSPVYIKRTLQSYTQTTELSDEVSYLVDYVWREAMGTLSAILRVPIRSIQLEKVEKAEAVLLEIRRAIEDGEEEDFIRSLSDRFFTLIPHKPGYEDCILSKRAIARKQDICQLIKDIVNANESTGWSQLTDAVSKYRALNCVIDWLKPGHTERERVEKLVISTQDEEGPVTIHNVFAVSRSVEESRYNHDVGNDQLLLHCSRPANFLGILSRGLLLPKIVVSELGVGRRDAGLLGPGLYFGDRLSKLTGTRLMVVARVALGNIKQIFKHDMTIEAPPEGFNSTHGVRKGEDIQSDFTEDEFVVYKADQQCIQYVVEFTFPEDTLESFARTISVDSVDLGHPAVEKPITKIDVADVQCALNPVAKVQSGLVAKDQNQPMVELQAVHVRARIQDLAAQVVVFQSYKNHSDSTIEAKYVFPLDDEAAVCGFEAFINNKHVIGVVKEKEEAKHEYRRAVAAGHGAYLMDEEAPNVFSVSVGNLPPKANVLIKITYVTELAVEGSRLAFTLLGSVAPWKRKEIKAKDTADDSKAYHVDSGAQNREESLQLSLQMASDIRSIQSPTHSVKIKYKSTQGSVELSGGAGLGDSFQLFIGLAEIHSPRLWVETHQDNLSQAAMLVFYPDFVTNVIHDPEIIVMLDLSNSMQGSNLEEARALSQLILKQLPAACTFNVVIFGTEYEELFSSSQTKMKSNLDKALEFIQTAEADRGSTEAWQPLRAYFLLKHSNIKPCNIFLVTDGHVTNEEATLSAINQNRGNSRIFTFGISSTANHHTLRSMSRLGGGAFEYFDIKAKSTWEKKVRQQVSRSCQPSVSNIRVEWETNDSDIIQAPAQITTVFSGSRLVIYALVSTCSQVVLKADVPVRSYGTKEITTEFAAEDLKKSQGEVLHQLAARSIVRDWEEGALHADRLHHEARKNELQSRIVSLSKEFSIITPFTSFIAVEEREEGEDLSQVTGPSIGELVAREKVDVMPSLDWQEITPHTEVSPEKQVKNLLHTANIATETFSFDAAERYYENAYKVAEEKLTPGSSLTLEIADTLSKFYFRVRRSAKKAFSVIDNAWKKQQEILKPLLPEEVTEHRELEQLDQLDKTAEWAQLCKSLEDSFEPADISPADLLTELEEPAEMGARIQERDEGEDYFEPIEDKEEMIVVPDFKMDARAESPELVLDRGYEDLIIEPVPRMAARASSPELVMDQMAQWDSLDEEDEDELIVTPIPKMVMAEPLSPDAIVKVPLSPTAPTPQAPPSPPKVSHEEKPKKKAFGFGKPRFFKRTAAAAPPPPPSRSAQAPLPGGPPRQLARGAPPPPPPPVARGAPPPSPPGAAAPPPPPPPPLGGAPPLASAMPPPPPPQPQPSKRAQPIPKMMPLDTVRRDLSIDTALSDTDDEYEEEELERGIDRARGIKYLDYDAALEETLDEKAKEQDRLTRLEDLLEISETLGGQAEKFEYKAKLKKKSLGISLPAFKREAKGKKVAATKPQKVKVEPPTHIGEIPLARKHKPQLDSSSIEKLLSLQGPGGDWQFSSSFDKILGIDSKICLHVIEHSQLAPEASADRLASIKTLLAVILAVSHLRIFLQSLPSKRSRKLLAICDKVQKDIETGLKCISFFLQDEELKAMPEKAGLGTDWWQIGNKFLGNVKK